MVDTENMVEAGMLKLAKELLDTGVLIDKIAVHFSCSPEELLKRINKNYPIVSPFKKKYIRKMWRIHNVLFFDKEKAENVEIEKVKKVYVGLDNDGIELDPNGFIAEHVGSWIFRKKMKLRKKSKIGIRINS